MSGYVFYIPNNKINIYFTFALIINFLNACGVSFLLPASGGIHWFYVTGALLVLTGLFTLLPRRRRLALAGSLMLVFGIFWMSRGFTEAFFADFILWVLYRISSRSLFVSVDADEIVYPSFPQKKIAWRDLDHIVLKDDILTMDLKNNKIYQHVVEYADNPVNEKEFNDFCTRQLSLKSEPRAE
ncbi:hypothetical protein ABDK00_008100 [Niabella insulamsoli]|uniref:hypothetical protein n=1 Tax=Niabella insulamsoli TaxID=3144874 RepID=UPI0031FD966D